MPARLHVLGIRHHGPGSARSVQRVLDAVQPTVVVIEGPPELEALVELADHHDLVPPVAALAYVPDEPRRASFYPLAAFSPEWVALRWAGDAGVPVRFADLPAANHLAPEHEEVLEQPGAELRPGEQPDAGEAEPGEAGEAEGVAAGPALRDDPIAALARAAGHDDPERWWEDAVEQREHGVGPDPGEDDVQPLLDRFEAIADAMAAVRAEVTEEREDLLRREAAMRQVLRPLLRDDDARVVVVCGAYHAPALDPAHFPKVGDDRARLANQPKAKVAVTWVPWTSARLSFASGYGAGVDSPGWYEHLFATPDHPIERWMVKVARELRAEQMDASPAAVVEATRLATGLAALRGRPLAGLGEVTDATRSVLCGGSDVPLALVHRRLVVGDHLGRVPDETPTVPLARDLARQQRTLRLKASAEQTVVTVDLRQPAQLARSVLFHRLALLGIGWATPTSTGRTTGTFKEAWQLEWRPELEVDLIEASVHGTTVEAAATSCTVAAATSATDLPTLAGLVEACLPAELPDALDQVLDLLAAATARQGDVRGLLRTVEPLARTFRYGDVREMATDLVGEVLDVAVTRGAIGLPTAVRDLDDDAAAEVRDVIEAADRGVALVDVEHLRLAWTEALASVALQVGVHGSVAGRVNRLLLDRGALSADDVAPRLARQLSVGGDPARAAAWLDGLLAGDAALLLHDPALLGIVDDWVARIDETTFDDLLPLVRRTFSRFATAERRAIGARLATGGGAVATVEEDDLDDERSAPAVAAMARLISLEARG